MVRKLVLAGIGIIFLAVVAVGAIMWFSFRVYVPENQCAVLIRKTGAQRASDQIVATEEGQKGIQPEVLGPGRHFYNPYTWDHEIISQTTIPSGDPSTWEWIHSLDDRQRDELRAGTFKFEGKFPQIGVVTRKIGQRPPNGALIVSRESGYQGILSEVLTPGVYKINPYVYDIKLHPAVVIPAGFVGVVTNLFGDNDPSTPEFAVTERRTGDKPAGADEERISMVRPLANPGERGTLRDVLQPGVYFINPKLQKVTLIEVGFNEYSQVKVSDQENNRIPFPSDTGYEIRVGVTVVWGIDPQNAASIINEFGNVDRVLDKVIGPQLRSIARNIGSTYSARDFIQGEKREQFQRALTAELQRVARAKHIEVLLALVRDIEVIAPSATPGSGDVTQDLKRTIQESYVAVEKQITKEKQGEAAGVRAQLEEEQKKIDIVRETIQADTRVAVANIIAEGEKSAAEIDAEAQLEVATIQQQVAELDAQRTEILGEARADVEKMRGEAEAKGYEMLVGALGDGESYNLYTFAQGFAPDSIRLFFAGEGTFWTDLSRFEELGAAKVLETSAPAAGKRRSD